MGWRGPFCLHIEALTFKGPAAKQTATIHATGVNKTCLQIRQTFGEPDVCLTVHHELTIQSEA
jgi:hypothetical protein